MFPSSGVLWASCARASAKLLGGPDFKVRVFEAASVTAQCRVAKTAQHLCILASDNSNERVALDQWFPQAERLSVPPRRVLMLDFALRGMWDGLVFLPYEKLVTDLLRTSVHEFLDTALADLAGVHSLPDDCKGGQILPCFLDTIARLGLADVLVIVNGLDRISHAAVFWSCCSSQEHANTDQIIQLADDYVLSPLCAAAKKGVVRILFCGRDVIPLLSHVAVDPLSSTLPGAYGFTKDDFGFVAEAFIAARHTLKVTVAGIKTEMLTVGRPCPTSDAELSAEYDFDVAATLLNEFLNYQPPKAVKAAAVAAAAAASPFIVSRKFSDFAPSAKSAVYLTDDVQAATARLLNSSAESQDQCLAAIKRLVAAAEPVDMSGRSRLSTAAIGNDLTRSELLKALVINGLLAAERFSTNGPMYAIAGKTAKNVLKAIMKRVSTYERVRRSLPKIPACLQRAELFDNFEAVTYEILRCLYGGKTTLADLPWNERQLSDDLLRALRHYFVMKYGRMFFLIQQEMHVHVDNGRMFGIMDLILFDPITRTIIVVELKLLNLYGTTQGTLRLMGKLDENDPKKSVKTEHRKIATALLNTRPPEGCYDPGHNWPSDTGLQLDRIVHERSNDDDGKVGDKTFLFGSRGSLDVSSTQVLEYVDGAKERGFVDDRVKEIDDQETTFHAYTLVSVAGLLNCIKKVGSARVPRGFTLVGVSPLMPDNAATMKRVWETLHGQPKYTPNASWPS